MADKSTYEKLKQRVKELEKEVTELKRAEELLKKSEEKFAKAFNLSPTLMTISSIEDGMVATRANRKRALSSLLRAHFYFKRALTITNKNHLSLQYRFL